MLDARQGGLSYSAGVVALGLILTIAGVFFPGWWQHLLSANGFIPHGHCYLWQPNLVWLHGLSDSLIALAYVGISVTLAYLVYRTRREIPFHWMFLAFGSFIIACASTHFMDVLTLWQPFYWLSGALKAVTAFASVTTALVLPALVPQALTLVETAKLSEERRSHLEQANQELNTLYDRLKELDQLKTQFFANVSHELRTPLALILGPTEVLLAQAANLQPEQQQQLELIDRNARLLLKQVNDLLDVSKLEAGKMELQTIDADLSQVVSLIAGNFDGLAQERQITFQVETPGPLPVQTDVAKVQRVLLNLLSNAFKFTPEGGSIRCQLLLSPATSAMATLIVCDSGPGIPVELRQSIFDRFQQGEGGATRRFGGTGLGLAIVKEFVELLGGTIAVSDAPAGGACFTVELPLATNHPSIPAPNPAPPSELTRPILEELYLQSKTVGSPATASTTEQSLGKPLVLIVEDNPEMNQFITTCLASQYRTLSARDGEDGWEQAIAHKPDLILSDVMMPRLSGEQLVQRLRHRAELDATPIVMLTAKADDELRLRLLQQGTQDYLMKPFSAEELRARVGNLITIKRTRDLLQQELATQSHDLETLAQEVSLRRRELQLALETVQQQADELAQANRLKDEFLAIVSHELRTPLNPILGWSKLLRSQPFDAATSERALEAIERNARLQAELIENLLNLSRLLQGKLLLHLHPLQLEPVIRAAARKVEAAAATKKITLQFQLDDSMPSLLGDTQRLKQVFQNLLINAIKFTPTGGQVVVTLKQQSKHAIVQITDSGEGIRAEVMPFIFDYFRQGDSSLTRKHGGLGLGLAIVRQLVELHGGKINVDSPGEGQGSTFTVTLPLMASQIPVPLSPGEDCQNLEG